MKVSLEQEPVCSPPKRLTHKHGSCGTLLHRCNKRFLCFFIQATFFYVFNVFLNFFPRFLFFKTSKIQRETLLEDASAMILVCYVPWDEGNGSDSESD